MNRLLIVLLALLPIFGCNTTTSPDGTEEVTIDWKMVGRGLEKAEFDLRLVATNYAHREDVAETATGLADIVTALSLAVNAYTDSGEQNSGDLLTQIDLALRAASVLAGQIAPEDEDIRLIITGLQLSLGWIQFAMPPGELEEHIENGGEDAMSVEGLPMQRAVPMTLTGTITSVGYEKGTGPEEGN